MNQKLSDNVIVNINPHNAPTYAHFYLGSPHKWKCFVLPHLILYYTDAPNWFQRKMQRIFFGFKWEKI